MTDDMGELADDEYARSVLGPDYIDFLVDSAVEKRIITAEHGEKWKAYYNGPSDEQTIQAAAHGTLPVDTPALANASPLHSSIPSPSTSPTSSSGLSLQRSD